MAGMIAKKGFKKALAPGMGKMSGGIGSNATPMPPMKPLAAPVTANPMTTQMGQVGSATVPMLPALRKTGVRG